MQVAQRGTSVTGITSNAYRTCDRWKLQTSGTGTWTMIQEALTSGAAKEAGFGFATRIDCTTAVASPSSGSYLYLKYMIEGQDLQGLAKGTSGAKAITISFWVKTTTTGVYQLSVRDANTRMCAGTYTVNSADTWEKKSITIPADTSGAIANTNAEGMDLSFWLGAGSNYTGGAAPTAWEAKVDTDRAAAMSHQMSSATSKDWAITGLQMELGSVATDFEHRSYGEELALCRRYYKEGTEALVSYASQGVIGNHVTPDFRATPTVTWWYSNKAGTASRVYRLNTGTQTTISSGNVMFVGVNGIKHWYNTSYADWANGGTSSVTDGITLYLVYDAEL
jgi:hypothetical protein